MRVEELTGHNELVWNEYNVIRQYVHKLAVIPEAKGEDEAVYVLAKRLLDKGGYRVFHAEQKHEMKEVNSDGTVTRSVPVLIIETSDSKNIEDLVCLANEFDMKVEPGKLYKGKEEKVGLTSLGKELGEIRTKIMNRLSTVNADIEDIQAQKPERTLRKCRVDLGLQVEKLKGKKEAYETVIEILEDEA